MENRMDSEVEHNQESVVDHLNESEAVKKVTSRKSIKNIFPIKIAAYVVLIIVSVSAAIISIDNHRSQNEIYSTVNNAINSINKTIIDLTETNQMVRLLEEDFQSMEVYSHQNEIDQKEKQELLDIINTQSDLDDKVSALTLKFVDIENNFHRTIMALKKNQSPQQPKIIKVSKTKPRIVGPNLNLVAVDRWSGSEQAVLETKTGQTVFMNQGEIRNGWQLVDIDHPSKTVTMVKDSTTRKLTIAM